MKIDISNLIGDLVEATVKSLKEVEGNPDVVKGKGTVKYKTAIGYTKKQRKEDPEKQTAYDAAIALRDGKDDDEEETSAQQTTDTDSAADDEVSGDGATDALKDKGPDDDADTTDEPTDTKPKSLRKANITQETVDAIDGAEKDGGLKGKVKAPGNIGSKINEISVGDGMAMFSENPEITVEEVSEALYNKISKTPSGRSNGNTEKQREDKNRKACLAAAISARRENIRVQEFMASEDLNPESTTVSHVWGATASLQNTVTSLKEAGVVEVNGIPLTDADPPPSYEDIILEGGAGENPTDTMIVMVDNSQTPPKAIILHTSNKMTTADIQSNSSTEKNVEAMKSEAQKLRENGEISEEEYNEIIKVADDTINEINDLQKQVESKVGSAFEVLENAKEDGTLVEKLADASPGKWQKTQDRYTKAKGATNPAPEFRVELENPPEVSEEEKEKIADAYVREMKFLATTEDPPYAPTKYMTALQARLSKADEEAGKRREEEINDLYKKQHEATNNLRQDMNKIKEGFGDRVMAETFMSRLHLNVAEGHAPGGIPPQYFELNMGINESDIRFDEGGKPYIKEGNKYYPLDEKTGRADTSGEPQGIRKLKRGDTATVGNPETIAAALGYKTPPPPENVAELITVREVVSNEVGPGGKAFIFGKNIDGEDVLIGTQTIRPKDGPGTKAQDTLEFSKAFQTRMQLASLRQAAQEAKEDIKESLKELQEFLKGVIV